MSDKIHAWGADPSPRFSEISNLFSGTFAAIRASAAKRDAERVLPYQEVGLLRNAGFFKLRLASEHGGREATLPELFGLLIELGAADSNLANITRPHLGFTEGILTHSNAEWRARWLGILARGETVGSGFSETGQAPLGSFETRLARSGDGWILKGGKAYTTGSLFSDWITVSAVDEDDQRMTVLVRTDQHGVSILDDWTGFGQTLTGSGTAIFDNVAIEASQITPRRPPGSYTSSLPQAIHLATLAGIARAVAEDTTTMVAARRRIFAHGNNQPPANDPQIQQVVGKIHAIAYATRSIVLRVAESLQKAYDIQIAKGVDAGRDAAVVAGIETAQSVHLVSTLVLDAASSVFDTLGASALRTDLALDRYWRNARTISSHNPRMYHDRLVADYYLNGAVPAEFSISVGSS